MTNDQSPITSTPTFLVFNFLIFLSLKSSNNDSPRKLTSDSATESDAFENKLRPTILSEYIGQSQIKDNLRVFLKASQQRNEPLEHTLLYGPPGLGKTTLAIIIAKEMGGNFKMTAAPAIEKQGDLAAILTNLQPGDVLFIDEIHRLKSQIEEILYSAMEDYCLDIIVGKGPSARTMRLQIPKFTLIGATTKYSMLSSPLRDRFGHVFKLDFYTEQEIEQILHRSANILGYTVDPEACTRIAQCARRTPRIANRLLKRVRDFAEVANQKKDSPFPVDISNKRALRSTPNTDIRLSEKDLEAESRSLPPGKGEGLGMGVLPDKPANTNTRGGGGVINKQTTEHTLTALGIDLLGLDKTDIDLLRTLIEKFHGGPVGLNTLSAATGEDAGTIEEVYEPFLIQLGFLDRSPRGRIATPHAYKHLGIEPKKKQETLF